MYNITCVIIIYKRVIQATNAVGNVICNFNYPTTKTLIISISDHYSIWMLIIFLSQKYCEDMSKKIITDKVFVYNYIIYCY